MADAEATVAEKERDLARKKTLEERHYTSTQDLDLAQASYDRAVAALASAQADVGVAEADLRLKETDLCMDRAGQRLTKTCVDALVAAGEVSKQEVERRKRTGR